MISRKEFALLVISIFTPWAAFAAVVLTDGPFLLYRSGIRQSGEYQTYEGCRAALGTRAGAETRTSGELTWACRQNVVAAYAPDPPPEPTTQWTHCANENAVCAFTGRRTVRYGARESWVVRDMDAVDGGVYCSNRVFGDPISGVVKTCQLSAVAPAPAPIPTPDQTNTALINWTRPTLNTDGTQLTDLAGYRIHYGRSPDQLSLVIQIADPVTVQHRVIGLGSGQWYFGVTAYATDGDQSSLSDLWTKAIP